MSVQLTQQPKPDLVQKYALRFLIAMIVIMIPLSVFCILSGGDGVKIGVLGLIACLGISGGMLSYKYC
jgi:membrane protein YqaA with SNARE-associated domain